MKTTCVPPTAWSMVAWRCAGRAFAAVVLAAATAVPLRAQTAAVSGPPAGTGSWTKTFEDNFDTFDAGKWAKRWACGNGNELGCTYQDRMGTAYEDANVYVQDGKLHIKTERKTTRGKTFTSGVVTTSIRNTGFMQKYGYFEVRMKPASSPGNDPCFWAFPLSKPSAEPFKEIDFAEFGGRGGVVATTSHMPGLGNQTFSKTGNWTSDFHTYGVLWEANKVTLYIDGVLQPGSITKNVVDEAGVLILSDEVRKDNGAWFGNSDNFSGPIISQVDWVRVWKPSGVTLGGTASASQLPGDVFPNPATGSCTIRLTVPTAQPVQLTVVDSRGAQVWAHTLATTPGTNLLPLNTAGLAAGLYTVRVVAGARQLVRSLVVSQ
ncbi:family 16 glycosylhydrolase [Hymenobacter weizhouensis]|uniref:family 16 glycosylhydrolase n=1 Tax=Hymenobacter sp. YIM 151500-1 TaxID=2987689 RepID=UPI0022270704|nr:family 16 glycosylhydrolase [Hymenobacter sp. YIM 151500-1]UYZ62280.1 family 16 glycosylhydrolase [Hymenobacter sp. YIM 151500-1]